MKKTKALILLSGLIFSSCKYGLEDAFYRKNPVEDRASKLSQITLKDSLGNSIDVSGKSSYSFIVISDVHFGAEKERKDDSFITFISALPSRPDFCICTGDIAEHGLEEEYINYNNSIVKPLANLGIPTANVIGNHDLYNDGWKNFQKYNFPGTSFYKFVVDGMSYYMLDSGSGNIGEPQMNELAAAFKNDSNPKMIFTHAPLYAEDNFYFVLQDAEERNTLISMFAKNNVKYFIGGHIHAYLKTDFKKFTEISVPAYLEQYGWSIFTIDKATKKIDYANYFLD